MSKVSIIIPIYNAEKYLVKTIQSVISQTYSDLELILVNDGSTDSSSKICMEFACRDNRIVFKNQENKGVSAARNNGLLSATGDWVYFLDSDDYISNDFFKKISPFLDDDIDVIQFGSSQINNNNIVSYRQSLKNSEKLVTNSFSEFLKTSNIGALCVWLHIINRNLVLQNKIYFREDMSHNEDMLFMYHVLINSKKHLFIGETIHTQLLTHNSLSRSPANKTKVNNRLLLIDRVIQLSNKNPKHKETTISEANKLLKGFFGSVVSFMIQRAEIGTLNYQDIRTFDIKYKDLYKKNEKFMTGIIPKIANINILLIIYPLKVKIQLNSKLKSIKNNFI